MILSAQEAKRILAEIKELKFDQPWIDFHVNPYEVIYNRYEYQPNPYTEGVWSQKPVPYSPPETTPLRIDDGLPEKEHINIKNQLKSYYQLILEKNFLHIGPRVIRDQMALSGFDKCVLLPIFQPESNGQREMEFMLKAYGNDERFILGYCVPNSVIEDAIVEDIRRARAIYKIAAVKFNANIMAIDLAKPEGKNRLKAMLKACAENNLPLVIHSGRSELVRNSGSKDYALLANMADTLVNYSKTTTIISHAGFFGASREEIKSDLLPLLEEILKNNKDIFVNIAGLDMNTIAILCKHVQAKNLLFGSDYPYFSQWGTLCRLWLALKLSRLNFETILNEILVNNPSQILLGAAR